MRGVAAIVAVGLLGAAVWQQREGLVDALQQIAPSVVGASALLALLALVASMLSWRALLTASGHRLPVGAAARLYFLTQIGKYLPGSIWPVVAQMEMGREQGISVARSGLAAVLNLVVGLATGAVVGLVALIAGNGSAGGYWWLVAALPLLLLALQPVVIRWAVALVLRLTRRPAAPMDLSGRGIAVAAAWSLAMWLLFGLHVHVLVAALDGGGIVRSIGAYALAWVVGFLVFVAPAGAGARELSLVLLLSPPLGRPAALAVAVVSRVVGIVADVVVALLGIAAEKVLRPRATRAVD